MVIYVFLWGVCIRIVCFFYSLFDLPEVSVFEGATADFIENYLVAETSTVMNSATGENFNTVNNCSLR